MGTGRGGDGERPGGASWAALAVRVGDRSQGRRGLVGVIWWEQRCSLHMGVSEGLGRCWVPSTGPRERPPTAATIVVLAGPSEADPRTGRMELVRLDVTPWEG